jgi:hypothetical protein
MKTHRWRKVIIAAIIVVALLIGAGVAVLNTGNGTTTTPKTPAPTRIAP